MSYRYPRAHPLIRDKDDQLRYAALPHLVVLNLEQPCCLHDESASPISS